MHRTGLSIELVHVSRVISVCCQNNIQVIGMIIEIICFLIIILIAFEKTQVGTLHWLMLFQFYLGLIQVKPFTLTTIDLMLFPVLKLLVYYEDVDAGPVLSI